MKPGSVDFPQRHEAAILIVDDAPANLELLRKSMSEQGYQTYVATSGERALIIAQRAQPDLILLDVLMPDMDGIETCRRLKQHPLTQRIPVLFMSSRTETDDVVAGHSIGELLSPLVTKEYLDYFAMYAANPETAHKHGTREVAIRHRNGDTLSMDLTLTPMYLRQPLYIGLLHDITHHKQSEDALQRAAYLDSLTKIANRRHFDTFLEKEWQRAVRNGSALSLVVLDVDHFKLYNDSLGHPAGDACLQQVAQAIDTHACRPGDLAARYGGEEFVMLFSETEADGAMLLAEAIRGHIESLQLPHPRSPTSPWITVSIGVATIHPHQLDDRATLFVAADRALYVAKEGGRNQVRATHSGSTAWETVKALVLR